MYRKDTAMNPLYFYQESLNDNQKLSGPYAVHTEQPTASKSDVQNELIEQLKAELAELRKQASDREVEEHAEPDETPVFLPEAQEETPRVVETDRITAIKQMEQLMEVDYLEDDDDIMQMIHVEKETKVDEQTDPEKATINVVRPDYPPVILDDARRTPEIKLHIRIAHDINEALKISADKHGRSKSHQIRHIIVEYLKREMHGE